MEQDHFQQQAKPYIEHDMIQKYTSLPEFPHFRTRLLYTFLHNGSKQSAKQSDLFSLVASLLQLGLDTHDDVENKDCPEDQRHTRSKQLKILAGDYFSGRFYQLLSQADQIDLIRKLSLAICEVNRVKLNLYMNMKELKLTAEDYLQQMVQIKSELFLSFTHLMHEAYENKWPQLLNTFTTCEVVSAEIARLKHQNRFAEGYGYWYLLQQASKQEQFELKSNAWEQTRLDKLINKYRLKEHLQHRFEQELMQAKQQLKRLRSKSLVSELQMLGELVCRWQPKSAALEGIIK